jgi:hypothetical protein
MGVRYRGGTVTLYNEGGFFFDNRPARRTSEDTICHSFTLWKRVHSLTLALQLQKNLEAADESDNDLVRLSATLEL